SFSVLHYFNYRDGATPTARLLLAANGYLYGTTYDGGTNGNGTVFRIARDGSSFSVLHSFDTRGTYPLAGLLEGSDGAWYGTAGVLFKISADGSGFSVLHDFDGRDGDGQSPMGDLIHGPDGAIYGTTSSGGAFDGGTIFRVGGDVAVIYS